MKTLTPLLTATAGVVSSSLVLGMTPVFAATFQTTLTLDSPGGTPLVDTVVFDWETDLTSGTVTEADLTNWSYELFGSGSSVYSETVVLNSVVQPIGGVSRTNIIFNFDLDTLTLGVFDNDLSTVQGVAATGLTYNIFGDSSDIFVVRRVDGLFDGSNADSSFSQETAETAESVPEPSSVMALLGLGLGVLATQRKKQA